MTSKQPQTSCDFPQVRNKLLAAFKAEGNETFFPGSKCVG